MSGLPFILVGVPSSFLRLLPSLLFNLVLIRNYLNFTWVVLFNSRQYNWYLGFKLFSFCIAIFSQTPFPPLSNHILSLLPILRYWCHDWLNLLRLIFNDEAHILTSLDYLTIMHNILLLNMSLTRSERSLHRGKWLNGTWPFLKRILKLR